MKSAEKILLLIAKKPDITREEFTQALSKSMNWSITAIAIG